ncbi:MAG: DUF2520 domain-containing protein [Bacteroidales bacterium]|nr:DUF2520 domain-containing protein [Bacteroidales bacterium]
MISEIIPFCLEAHDRNTLKILKNLAAKLSSNVHEVSSEQRVFLHLAAVYACNFTNHMIFLAEKLIRKNGLSFSMLNPLIKETFEKLENLSPQQAQTGPAVRNDKNIMEKHLSLLDDMPEMKDIYRMISENIYKSSKEELV